MNYEGNPSILILLFLPDTEGYMRRSNFILCKIIKNIINK